MSEKTKLIWELYEIPIEEYARSFNNELSAASERVGIHTVEEIPEENSSVFLIEW